MLGNNTLLPVLHDHIRVNFNDSAATAPEPFETFEGHFIRKNAGGRSLTSFANFIADTGHCHGKPPSGGCMGFPRGGILSRNGSQRRQLQEFQPKNWYNGALLAVLTSGFKITAARYPGSQGRVCSDFFPDYEFCTNMPPTRQSDVPHLMRINLICYVAWSEP